jgi:predicted GNAT family N-acyltransferase
VSVNEPCRVRLADWTRDQASLQRIRRTVFVEEQKVPEALEWDGVDADCRHVIAENASGTPLGCARLLPDGHIGRLAVLASARGRGIGGALLARMVALAAELGHRRVVVNAQTHALAFYERHGFVAFGPEFDDAGIAHQAMARPL